MAQRVIRIPWQITSSTGGSVASDPVRVGGNVVGVQVVTAPASLVGLQLSEDKVATHWSSANDNSGAIASKGTGISTSIDRGTWARVIVATDASGPRTFEGFLIITKEE